MYYHNGFLKKFEKRAILENLVRILDSLSRGVVFDYEYLRKFEAKIKTACKVV
jgi:hypothetical protein